MTATDGAYIVFAMLGLVLGFLLGADGFGTGDESGEFSKSQRVQNVIWLIFGGVAILIADLQKFGVPKDLTSFDLAIAYAGCALMGGVLGFLITNQSISGSVREFNRSRQSQSNIDIRAVQREFLLRGRNASEKLLAKLKAEAVAIDRAREVGENERKRKARLETNKLIGSCVYLALRHLELAEPEQRQKQPDFIRNVQDLVRQVASFHARSTLNFRVSVMIYVPAAYADADFGAKARFLDRVEDAPMGYLKVVAGAMPNAPDLVLPVASNSAKVLPGAPEAVIISGVTVMNLSKIDYRAGVSAKVKEEIKRYFAEGYFTGYASVTSIAIQNGNQIHGTVNIESSALDLFGTDGPEDERESAVKDLAASLQPLIAVLSIIK